MSFKIINTFDDVELTKEKPLIICDIDNTILHHGVKIDHFIKMIKEDKRIFFFNEQTILQQAQTLLNYHCCIVKAEHTDEEGFNKLLNNIKLLNGNIIFLTSRTSLYNQYTKKHFNDIGLNYNDYKVHYTNNTISKGDYIKNNINTSQWNEGIFIDDLDFNLISVFNYRSDIKCYKFVIK